ncbi:hypothetical protein [Nisaea denitrificans]|uniref:hypothetical protein n=1 Tax=Nisaea denitrificans TaxID=390877 RepID=UPI000685C2FB|nr:hypothetical protein [Nisaea denitrificans]
MAESAARTRKKRHFLKALAETGNVSEAARKARLDRSNAYQIRRQDQAFADAWDDALDMAVDLLEAEARSRAVEGVEQPRFHQGRICGTVRKYSDSLLMFLLRAHRPETFREGRDAGSEDLERHLKGAKEKLAARLKALSPPATLPDDESDGTDPVPERDQ